MAGVVLAVAAAACGGGSDDHTSQTSSRIAVLSAFPAELAAVLEHATIDETTVVGGHIFRLGTVGDTPVVAAMTGIGLVNAAATTNLLLDNFEVSGVIVSGVAASSYHIGDVVVPEVWRATDGTTFAVDPEWLELAKDVASGDDLSLQQCTLLPMDPTKPEICLADQPVVVVGGVGHSADPFNGRPLLCSNVQPRDIFGCDVSTDTSATATLQAHMTEAKANGAETPVVEDEETAAIAQAAADHGARFIAFRAASDQGSFNDFFIYYRLAAHNAAAGAAALVGRL